jgi:hypothetical protein
MKGSTATERALILDALRDGSRTTVEVAMALQAQGQPASGRRVGALLVGLAREGTVTVEARPMHTTQRWRLAQGGIRRAVPGVGS